MSEEISPSGTSMAIAAPVDCGYRASLSKCKYIINCARKKKKKRKMKKTNEKN
jgi:hypothetical protein